ncbi:hypothetical protein CKAH01_04976 [Colletotrichum kahawae]|uniref:Bacteriophage T5 Orf172 DNA-binding domain-containing protein n=1 Tax=Colletotrichum kahawae TaxID=34407 RepID=A0AAD9YHZ1_COLKA|nr:hypothetical protein CKAH01_04976 [Colletotrichum kahawae]
MMPFESSSNGQNNGSQDARKRPSPPRPSVRNPKRRSHAADTTHLSSKSSPLAPTQPDLAPHRVRKRASSQLSARNIENSCHEDLPCVEPFQGTDIEADKSSRKPAPRVRSIASGSSHPLESSPIQQRRASNNESRPPLGTSHTSPEMHDETERRQQRPDLPERGASDADSSPKKLSSFQIDRNIAKLIRDGPSYKKDIQIGSIYLLKVKPTEIGVELFKIGRTQKHPDRRRKQIKAVCAHNEAEEHTSAVAEEVDFHGFAEKLIHAELANFKHQWVCNCGTRHKEYFDVNEDYAVQVFERWRDFCRERPWNLDGKILPSWEQRLQNMGRFSGTEKEFNHWELARRWSVFASPMTVERVASDAIRLWKDGFPKRWRIVALAEFMTMACISRVSFWTTAWTVVIVGLLLVDLLTTDNMHTLNWIDRLMGGGLQAFMPGVDIKKDGKSHQTQTLNASPARETDCPTPMSTRVIQFEDSHFTDDCSLDATTGASPDAMNCDGSSGVEICPSPSVEAASRRNRLGSGLEFSSANTEIFAYGNREVEVVDLTGMDSD